MIKFLGTYKYGFLLILTVLLFYTSCVLRPVQERQFLIEELKTAEVQLLPDSEDCYIVRLTDGSVWFVQTYSSSVKSGISAKTQLFPAK